MSTTAPRLSADEIARYGRHLTLPEVGMEGQERLKAGSVLVVGAGGLGSPAALYLAAAGVGRLGLVDFDRIDRSNLQRQVLYGTADVGRPKLDVAVDRLRDVNPEIEIVPHPVRLSADNALELVRAYDVVLDGTDNFGTRYLVNDACVLAGRPNVYGSIYRFEGQASVFWAGRGPCYRCVYPEPPPPGVVPSCAEGGVLGVLPGIVGAIQAAEALKLLLGVGDGLLGRLLLLDALGMRWRELRLRRDADCPACGDAPTIRELREESVACEVPAADGEEVEPRELARLLASGERVRLVDVRSPQEWAIGRLEGATHVPLEKLPGAMPGFAPEEPIVLYCHLGIRSARAAAMMRAAGFVRARSLRGGTEAWATEVDPAMPRY